MTPPEKLVATTDEFAMARVTTSTPTGDSDCVYTPPQLPEYLKNVYDLKQIVGTPSDEEMKGIHAVIRVAAHMSQSK